MMISKDIHFVFLFNHALCQPFVISENEEVSSASNDFRFVFPPTIQTYLSISFVFSFTFSFSLTKTYSVYTRAFLFPIANYG